MGAFRQLTPYDELHQNHEIKWFSPHKPGRRSADTPKQTLPTKPAPPRPGLSIRDKRPGNHRDTYEMKSTRTPGKHQGNHSLTFLRSDIEGAFQKKDSDECLPSGFILARETDEFIRIAHWKSITPSNSTSPTEKGDANLHDTEKGNRADTATGRKRLSHTLIQESSAPKPPASFPS